jgi:GR25 family glycosyltransferase involved in LPS biosynthesis
MNNIDAIIYINLEHRKDRNEHILQEIKKLCNDESKIHRINAIYKFRDGALGCSMSHIKAIEYILEHPEWNNCLILEDDFTFNSDNINENNKILSNVFKEFPNFDCVNLSYTETKLKYENTHIENVKKAIFCLTAAAYIVPKHFLPKILENFRNSVNDRISNGSSDNNCIDVYWCELMKKSNWYIIKPRLGYQYNNFSDIEKQILNYIIT